MLRFAKPAHTSIFPVFTDATEMSRSSLLWCFENPMLTYRLTVCRSGQFLHWTCLLCNEQHVWKSGIHKRSKDSFPASAVSRRQKGVVWSRNLTWVWHVWNWEGCDLGNSCILSDAPACCSAASASHQPGTKFTHCKSVPNGQIFFHVFFFILQLNTISFKPVLYHTHQASYN